VPAAFVFFYFLGSVVHAQHVPAPEGLDADAAINRLLAGNARYVAQPQRMTHENQDAARRVGLAGGQHPFAAVLSCSDSRVPPEVIFDQGLGDLFVVRVAGNVASKEAVASLQYAVDPAHHVETKLVLVLGHESCGAVDATLGTLATPGNAGGYLSSLVSFILPAAKAATGADAAAKLDSAVRINVENAAKALIASQPILAPEASSHRIKIVGGRYDLHSGRVQLWYPSTGWQPLH
jgi:carbonic anhydrase